MRLVLVGPPGSGKGTQAAKLCERLGLMTIGTGELLREAIKLGTPAGHAYETQYTRGSLAPDALVNELVAELFRTRRPEKFLMDGYPRTYAQAIAFDALLHQEYLKLDAVLNFTIPDAEVVRRIGGRRVCGNTACAATFNIVFVPPKCAGVCDKCGSDLIHREDDQEASVVQRLKEFHKNNDALIDHYRRAGIVKDIPAMDGIEAIHEAIMSRLP